MAWSDPQTWVALTDVMADDMNREVRDNFKAIGDSWTAYTPTVSGWTRVNGAIAGAFMQAGKLTHYRITYTLGSSDTISGLLRLTLPSLAAGGAPWYPSGRASLQDVSAGNRYFRNAAKVSSSTSEILLSDDTGTQVSSTVPFTFATGDIIQVAGTYEGQ